MAVENTRTKKIIITTAIVLLIAGIITTGIYVYVSSLMNQSRVDPEQRASTEDAIVEQPVRNSPLTPEQEKQLRQSGATIDPATSAKVVEANRSGDPRAAIAVYRKAIDASTNQDERVALLIAKSELLASVDDIAGAIQAALQAEAISGLTTSVSSLLAVLYGQQKNNPLAARYYRQAAQTIVGEDNLGNRQYFLERAAFYEAQP